MTEQEILEGNILIAQFMGGTVINNIFICKETTRSINERCLENYNISQAKYDVSWDWLMPVVEKIWDICECRESIFYFEYKGQIIVPMSSVNNIQDCYIAVIEFIKWYNKSKE